MTARLSALRAALGAPALLSLLDQGAVSGFGFLAGIVTARLIGVEAFGRFALVLIVAGFAQGLHNAVVTAPLMTLAGSVRGPSRYAGSIVGGTVLLSAVLALGVAAVLAAYFGLRGQAVPTALVAAAAALTLAQNLQLTARRLLFAFGGGGTALLMDAVRAIGFVLALAVAWLIGVALDAAEVVGLLAFSAVVTALPVLATRAAACRRRPLAVAARRHWRMARWLLPVVLVTFGQEQLIWILAGGALGDEALGGLRAAQYLVGLVLLILAATENVVPTRASQAYDAGGEPALRTYLLDVTRRIGVPMAALLVLVGAPAPLWLNLVFGPDYVPYAPCVRWLALGVAFIFLRDMTAQIFRARRRTDVIFRAFAVSFAVSLALLQPLLGRYGATGAAAVVVAGHGASLLVLLATLGGSVVSPPGIPERC